MNYYIIEGKPSITIKYNAGAKARIDVERILVEENFSKIYIPTKHGVRKNKIFKIFQYFQYFKNRYIWNKQLKKLQNRDNVIIQYPLNNTTFDFAKIINKYSKKGINFTVIIHDIDSLRSDLTNKTKNYLKRINFEDKTILKEFNKIISHNKKMTEELLKLGCKKERIIELEIFDYLVENTKKFKEKSLNLPIIIAGNLSAKKASYIKKIGNISNVNFNLYGKGIDFDLFKNVDYKGSFLPDELPFELEGSFGLVWDGYDIDSCKGPYGNYLRYNNPHKLSLYLVSGLPVIIWKEAALAKYVLDYKVGIVIDNLEEIPEKLKNITEEEYITMVNNVQKISTELRNGANLKRVIRK